MALGQLFASKLASFLPARSPLLATDNNDPLNLITNALCQTSSAGLATGWVAYGSASTGTITPSIVTDAALPGSGQRGTVAAATGTMGYRTPRISTGYAVGDRLSFAGVVTSSGGVAAQIWIICNGAPSNNFQPLNSTPALTRQLFEGELIVPTGTTSIDFILRLPPGSGSTDLYQATCYNLTAQGIDTV